MSFSFGQLAQRSATGNEQTDLLSMSDEELDALIASRTGFGFDPETAIAFQWPSLPQSVVDAAAGFGDAISFGASRKIRSLYGIDGGVDSSSFSYQSAAVGGVGIGVLSGGVAVNAGVRLVGGARTLFHFTSASGAAGIAQSGIRASSGIWGRGVYTVAARSPLLARASFARSTQVAIPVSGARSIPTPWPGTFIIP